MSLFVVYSNLSWGLGIVHWNYSFTLYSSEDIFNLPGCTTGSTHVEQQLKELKDGGKDNKEPKDNRDTNNITSNQEKKQTNKYTYGLMKNRLETDQSVFRVYKGVKCFDFSKDKNIIVTGGMDRIVRLWNPYVSG